ncbi:MAG: M16 family metallopeptidase [Betaproteobacteria bacterium]
MRILPALLLALAPWLAAAQTATPPTPPAAPATQSRPAEEPKKPAEPTTGPGTKPGTPPPESVPTAPPKVLPAAPARPAPGRGRKGEGEARPAPAAKGKAPAPAIGAKPVKATEVEGITEYRLANGLRVLLFPDPSKPTVTVNITYLVGSRHENYGETGMAHLLEHLMFKGTPKHPHIDQEYNQRGVRFNGTTWLDRTNYFELFQASDANLAWAIELEADRMVNSFIARKDLDSEMTVVRNEYEQGENSPFSVMVKRMQSISYDWHSYGRSTIGNRSDIENVDIAHLQAFYRTYYQPDNAVLLIAGKFDPQKALALVAQHFNRIPRPTRVLPPEWTVEPTQDGPREFQIRRRGDVQLVVVSYHVPSNLTTESDAVGFANLILAQVPTGRLHKALVETGKAAQVFGFPLMGKYPGLQMFGAVVKKGSPIEPVRDEMTKIVESFGETPPTEEEMKRTRVTLLNQAEKTLANHESLGVQLSEYIALGDWRLFFLSRDDVDKVTAQQVAEASKKYFVRDNRTTGVFVPDDNAMRAEIPGTPTVESVMKDFKPKAATSQAEAFDPSQDNINRRTKRIEIGGVKLALLPKKNRGETVNVSIQLEIGNAKDLFGQRMAASMAGRMLSRGTTRLTRTQLSDEFERLKVSGRVSGPSARLQTTRPNLDDTLRLVAEVLKQPRFDPNEFEQLRNQMITGLQSQLSEPEALAGDELSRHFNIYPKGDWRYSPSLQESIDEVKAAKLEDAKRFHDDFYGAQRAEISIVGDFDAARAEQLVRELFADWKAKVPYERVPSEFKDIAPEDKSITTPDKENAVFLARQNIALKDDDPDYPALFVANYILGGGAGFDSRLGTRIRQKEGLSYGVGSELSVDSLDRVGAWSAYAIAAPGNVAKVEAAFKDEVARAIKGGFTDAEVNAAKSGILQMRAQTRSQDGSLAAAWSAYLYLGRTFDYSKDFEQKVMALKPEQVTAVMRKYIDPAKVTIVKAGDFRKK